jgi:hypothetical protein
MWEPQPLANVGASTACNRDIFTLNMFVKDFISSLQIEKYLPELSRDPIIT